MRRLRRPTVTPPTLADAATAGEKRKLHRTLYETAKALPSDFEDYWSEPDVRGLLTAMQGRVCAYCGIATNGLDVEHFRPKGKIDDDREHGGYWWLAYDCGNYFLGCTVCNQKRKRNRFPLESGAARATYETRNDLGHEKRLLLDPAADPVEEWLSVEWEDPTCRLIPNPALDAEARKRVDAAIEFFGLNLDPEVRKQRSEWYEAAVRAAHETRWDDLRRMAMRHHPHSFAARAVLAVQSPDRLPTPEEDLTALLETLWKDLATQLREIDRLQRLGKKPGKQDQRQAKALCWALAVLWKEPPAANPAFVEQFLMAKDMRDVVADFLDKLG